MFTGLIQGIGRIRSFRGQELVVSGAPWADLQAGESICVNGCCLTLARHEGESLHFDLSKETLARSRRPLWTPGTAVNLERALTLQTPLGGHMVTGHVDGLGRVERPPQSPEWILCAVYPKAFDPLIVEKGSIAVHGVSLTVARLLPRLRFQAALVPETLQRTTLGALRRGDTVHLEFDLVGKYLAKWAKRA
jgi:riboflavin synthase